MPTLGRLQTRQAQYQANMTEQNHLGMLLHAGPTVLNGVMDQLFSAQNLYSKNPLLSNILGQDETIGTTSWEWEMKGADTKPAVVLENISPANAGQYGREFKIKLDVDWYLPSDVISPGNHKYSCRVQSDRVKSGNGWIYTVVLNSTNRTDFVPAKYLASGTKWSKLYATGSEANKDRGSTVISTPITFKDHLGKLVKQYSITDYASTEVLRVAIPDSNGKYHKTWIRMAEIEYWKQWYQEQEIACWYSRDGVAKDPNGRPIRTFAGIDQKISEDGHYYRYGQNQLNAKLIEEFLMDIFYGRVSPDGNGRKIKGFTGEYGLLQFHNIIQDISQKSGFLQIVDVSNNFITKEKSPYNSNALGYGYQFVKYRMANGIELEMVHNPLNDDRNLHTEVNPLTGKPYESEKITFLDFAGDSAKSNIRKMKKENGYAFGYVEGMYGPTGPSKGGKMAHAGSYYEMHVEDHMGVQIDDPTKCGMLDVSRD